MLRCPAFSPYPCLLWPMDTNEPTKFNVALNQRELELILASLSTLTQEYRLLASTEEELHLDKQVSRRGEVAEEAQLLANRLVEICHPRETP
jgi:hypothetical protein